MQRLIERMEGVPFVSPSLREVPLAENPAAVDFAQRLISGQIDIVVLLTGVGTRHMVAQIEKHVDRARFLAALSDVTTVVRGPKPVAALKEMGIDPTFRAPEPNTWREVLTTLDREAPVANQTVAVQEYGLPNRSLVAGLEARGAQVQTIKVYSWELPEDTAPLEQNLARVAVGEIDVLMFTSAHQVVNVLRMADKLGLTQKFFEACRAAVIASIGPTTSEMLRECDLPVDLEPEHSKMGHLVTAAAEQSGALLAAKRQAQA
jgi:uroporphyrinogen-III synthase